MEASRGKRLMTWAAHMFFWAVIILFLLMLSRVPLFGV
jgi:hypothetical protein